MTEPSRLPLTHLPLDFLRETEMVNLTRQYDWASHQLGAIDEWPDSLTTVLGTVLNNKVPMLLLWGPELFSFYNDAFRFRLGETATLKHTVALGKRANEVWSNAWNLIGPHVHQVLAGGESVLEDDQPIPFFRSEKFKDLHGTTSYTAIMNTAGSIDGIMVICKEIPAKLQHSPTLQLFEGEEGFRSLAENLPDILSRHDKSYRYTYANSRLSEYIGRTLDEVVGKSFLEVGFTSDNAQFFEKTMAEVFSTSKACAGELRDAAGNYMYARFIPEFDKDRLVRSVLLICTDITDRKKTEQAFQDNKERLQAALDASLTGTFRWDIQTNDLSWDANLDRLFGLPPGNSVQSLENFIERVHPDDRQGVIAQCQRCATDGSDFSMEFRVVWPEGTVRWLVDNGKTHKSESGKPIYMTGACVDVTNAVESRNKIEASELRFRSTFENAAVGVAHVALDGRWLLINNTLSQIVGYSTPEMAQLTFQDLTHPEDLQTDLQNVSDVLAGKISTYSMEKRYVRKDKSLVWVNLTVSLQRGENQQPLYFISLVQDISERKKAEELLTETRNQLTQLSNFMPQMVWSTQADGYHDFFNKQWYDFSGLTYADTKAEGWSAILHPDDVARTWRVWNDSLRTGQLYETKYRMRRFDGEYRWLLARAMPFRNSQGVIVRWFGTCTDIHEQKALEEQLEELVAERTHRLKRSNEDLQQFAHVASHDLKEPLRKIRLFADQAKTLLTKTDAVAVPYLAKIDKSVARMSSMIDGVLEYSSMDAGEISFEIVDLNSVLKGIEFDLEFLLAEKHATLEYHSLPQVRGINILLQRVFSNLIHNSLKFSHPDRHPLISVEGEKIMDFWQEGKALEGNFAKIIIRDNGIGFSNDHAEKIFSPFTRLHSKDSYEGTGLGLALCRKIIERLGGTIEANGVDGKGAEFIIVLPCEREP